MSVLRSVWTTTVAMEGPGSVVVVHLIAYKDIRDVLEDTKVEGHVLLFKRLDSIEHRGIQNGLVYSARSHGLKAKGEAGDRHVGRHTS